MAKTYDLGAVSAYAIAVEHGYTGTEQEWIDELSRTTENATDAKEAAEFVKGRTFGAVIRDHGIQIDEREIVTDSLAQRAENANMAAQAAKTAAESAATRAETIAQSSVRFDVAQTLTKEQQETAQNNIGVVGKCEDISTPNGINFNDYTTTGRYCFDSPTIQNSLNGPAGVFSGGILEVEADYTAGLVSQSLLSINGGAVYSRWKYVDGWQNSWGSMLNQAETKPIISILFIGNSLTQDGVAYLPYVLKQLYPDVRFKFYMWYNGGYTPEQHYSYFVNGTKCQIFSVAEGTPSWTNFSNSKSITDILNSYTFDAVVIQEYLNVRSEYTETEMQGWINCQKYISEHYPGGNPLKFYGFLQASNQPDDTAKYNLSLLANKLILQKTIAEDIIPAGIVIHEARKTELNSLGDNGHLTPDNTHTQEGLPCLLQTMIIARWILDLLNIPKSIYYNNIRITQSVYNSINVPAANLGTGVITGTDAQNILAQEVAIKAYKKGRGYITKWLVDGAEDE